MRAYLSRTSAPTPVLIRAANGFQIILGKVRPNTSPGREPSTSSDHCSPQPEHAPSWTPHSEAACNAGNGPDTGPVAGRESSVEATLLASYPVVRLIGRLMRPASVR